MRFEEIVGQDQAVTVLRRAIARGRVPHAYLFEGPPSVGKRSAAIGLGLALNCRAPARASGSIAGDTACGVCDDCRRILGGLHPDVLTFAPDGTQLLMEQAQEIVALSQRRPHEAAARVIIIDDADRLNANAANCLLKTLEEPAAGTHLVLVTAAPERLLGTIRSRTQRVRFRLLTTAALLAIGARHAVDPQRAAWAAVLAAGCASRFLELGTDAGDEGIREAVATLQRAVGTRGAAAGAAPTVTSIFDTAAELGDKEGKQRLPEALALLARMYRDALVASAGAPELATLDAETVGARIDAQLSLGALGRSLVAIVEADTDLQGNVNTALVLERLLLGLRRQASRETGLGS